MSAFQSTSSSLLLLRVIKFTPIKSASAGGIEMGLTTGAVAGSSSSRKDGTGLDVLTGGASSTPGASRAPRDDDASDEDADDEETPLDDTILTTVLEETTMPVTKQATSAEPYECNASG
jgi:hypothetical protein